MESNGLMNKPGFKYGLFLGIILSIIWITLYFLKFESLFYGFWKMLLTCGLLIVFIILAMFAKRKLSGGYLKYGNAVAAGLGVSLVASTFTVITAALLHFVIDTDLHERSKPILIQQQIDTQEYIMDVFSVPEEMREQQLEQLDGTIEKIQESELTMGSLITGGLGSMFGYLFVGLIISLLAAIGIKKNPPPFHETRSVTSEDLAP